MTMTKAHKPGSQKPGPDNTKPTGAKKPASGASSPAGGTSQSKSPEPKPGPSITIQTGSATSKQGGKSSKQAIGGTAVPGAKSTLPKEIKTTSPSQQEAESYNREMRRRMQHMGMGSYAQGPADVARNRRQKRIDKRKQQQEEVKKTVVTKGPSTNIKLGRRNTYFVLGTLALILLIIVIAIIIRHPF
jgi:hypothetical protein